MGVRLSGNAVALWFCEAVDQPDGSCVLGPSMLPRMAGARGLDLLVCPAAPRTVAVTVDPPCKTATAKRGG
jgi:hypothetical protein